MQGELRELVGRQGEGLEQSVSLEPVRETWEPGWLQSGGGVEVFSMVGSHLRSTPG